MSDESDAETDEIEKEKPVKLKHHLIDSVGPFEVTTVELSGLRHEKHFI